MAFGRTVLRFTTLMVVALFVAAGLAVSFGVDAAGAAPTADAENPAVSVGCKDKPHGPRILSAYIVKGDELTHRKGTDCLGAREIWARFAELIPAERRTMVTRFELLTRREQGAEVFQNRNLKSWTLAVGQGLGSDLDYILIHEFAHLLTLGPAQVLPVSDADAARAFSTCETYFTGEGCAGRVSLINQFVNRYWPVRHIDIVWGTGLGAIPPVLSQRFPNRYVTAYSATNPGEDIAETFAVFVVLDFRPLPINVAAQKVNFMWNRPAMRALRDQIRADL